ncbi:MAG: hypothetical protein AB7Q97_14340 [Gammaproteobacteria bacterium]
MTGRILATAAAVLALSPLGAARALDNTPCECWTSGYEDAAEFRWDNRAHSDNYTDCARKGQAPKYEQGFKARLAGKERKCPVPGR